MNQRVLEARFRVDLQSGGRSFRLDAELAMSGGVLALYGPSGSGKSTVLRALAGLLRPSSGQISIGQRAVYDSDGRVWQPAHRRSSGYVPQQRSLLPFLDVWGNVVFGLERHKRRRGNPEVVELLEELGIAGLAGARPQSLSGGEAQKVALARALAVSPGLLLLDEPFSSVDHASRARLLATVSATLKTRSLPALLVTHDPEEVRAVADEVVLIEGGRTRAQGPVSELLGPTP